MPAFAINSGVDHLGTIGKVAPGLFAQEGRCWRMVYENPDSGATTRELMARVGLASPAEDRDTALAIAFSEMVKTPSVASISDRPRDIRGMAASADGA